MYVGRVEKLLAHYSQIPLCFVNLNGKITRAEVATIFFRLLTDETREANMTKGMLSVAASFVALLLGIVVVHLLFHGVLVAFVAGEIGGFLAGSVVVACLVIAAE